MSNMKSIRFPPPVADDMVCAILDGRKTVTRQVVKPNHLRVLDSPYHREHSETPDAHLIEKLCEPPYRPGDILYVRETWRVQCAKRFDAEVRIEFKAGGPMTTIRFQKREEFDAFVGKWANNKWHPSIHMPREAARLFLRVTNTWVERLQNITEEQAEKEGCSAGSIVITGGPWGVEDDPEFWTARESFSDIWDSTIKRADLAIYGWAANPWAWVTEFERIGKEEIAE